LSGKRNEEIGLYRQTLIIKYGKHIINEMGKIVKVKVCIGTLCHIMGGSELQLLSEHLPEKYVDLVEIKGSTCLDYCNNSDNGNPPFVEVNGRCVAEATVAKVLNVIKEELENGIHQ